MTSYIIPDDRGQSIDTSNNMSLNVSGNGGNLTLQTCSVNDNRNASQMQQKQPVPKRVATLPDAIHSISETQFNDFYLLEDLTSRVDDAIQQIQSTLFESTGKYYDLDKLTVNHGVTQQRLRIHISDTSSNQTIDDSEQDTLQAESWLQKPITGWTIRFEGEIVDSQNSNLPFTYFFDKIIVIWNRETLIWDKVSSKMEMVSSIGGVIPMSCNGFEISRTGLDEEQIKIILFFSHKAPVYGLSGELSQLLCAHHASLGAINKAFWDYVEQSNLMRDINCQAITTDVLSAKLFNVTPGSEILVKSIPELLNKHLRPPRPVIISHSIRSRNNDGLINHQAYDFVVEYPFRHFADESDNNSSAPANAAKEFNTEIQKLDSQIDEALSSLDACLTRSAHFTFMSNKPETFIESMLQGRFQLPNSSAGGVAQVNTGAIDEYQIVDKRGETFHQPWVQLGVQRYLDNQSTSLSDQIRKYAAVVESERTLVNDCIYSNIAGMASSFRSKRSRRQERPMAATFERPFAFPFSSSPFGGVAHTPTSMTRPHMPYHSSMYGGPNPGPRYAPTTGFGPFMQMPTMSPAAAQFANADMMSGAIHGLRQPLSHPFLSGGTMPTSAATTQRPHAFMLQPKGRAIC